VRYVIFFRKPKLFIGNNLTGMIGNPATTAKTHLDPDPDPHRNLSSFGQTPIVGNWNSLGEWYGFLNLYHGGKLQRVSWFLEMCIK